MTKLNKVLAGFIGVCIVAATSLSYAQNTPGPDEDSAKIHNGQRIHEIFNQLNLTDDQKQQLEANKKQHREKMQSARQSMKSDKGALQAELMKPQLDMPKINEIHQQIKTLQSQMEDDKLSSILEVRSILTPDQFSKFVNLTHKHKPEHGE